MSFVYKGFKIERQDENNICLYEEREVETRVKGVPTGTEVKPCLVGYYTSFLGAMKEMVSRLAEKATDVQELKQLISEWEEVVNGAVAK